MTAYQVTVFIVAGVQEWQPNADRDALTSTDEQPPWQQSGYQRLVHVQNAVFTDVTNQSGSLVEYRVL